MDPEAETDEEAEALPIQAAQPDSRAAPRLPAGTLASKALTSIRALPVQQVHSGFRVCMHRGPGALVWSVAGCQIDCNAGVSSLVHWRASVLGCTRGAGQEDGGPGRHEAQDGRAAGAGGVASTLT